MRIQSLCLVLSASLLACGPLLAAPELKSGPQVGERLPGSFHSVSVVDAGKPDLSGRRWDHVERYGANPAVPVLARTDSDSSTKTLKRVDVAIGLHRTDNRTVHALLIMLSDDEPLDQKLRALAQNNGIKHVSLSMDTPAGPSSWRIAKDAH